MNNKTDCSSLLKYLRNETGRTQADIADEYGIEERTLRRWENKEYNPRWNDVVGLIEGVYKKSLLHALIEFNDNIK